MKPYGNLEKILQRTIDILNSGESDIPEIKVKDLYGNTDKLIYNLCQLIIEGGGGGEVKIVSLLSITTEPSAPFEAGSKYFNNTNSKIYTSIEADSWEGAIIEDPKIGVIYSYDSKYYYWDGIQLESISYIIDYNRLVNKPKINGIDLINNKTAIDLNIIYGVDYIASSVDLLPQVMDSDKALVIYNKIGTFYKTDNNHNWVVDDSREHIIGQVVYCFNNNSDTTGFFVCYSEDYDPIIGNYYLYSGINIKEIANKKDIIPLLSITSEFIGEFPIGSKYYNNTNKKIYTSTLENSWNNAIIEDPEYNIFYIYNNKIYIWDGNNLVLSSNDNYNNLNNKPSINNIVLEGNKDVFELGIIKNVSYIIKGDIQNLPAVEPPQTALLINEDTGNSVFYKTRVGENTWVLDEEANNTRHIGQIVIGMEHNPNCVICYKYTNGLYFYDNKPNKIIPSQLDQNYLLTKLNFSNCYFFYSWINEEFEDIVYTRTIEDGVVDAYYHKINTDNVAENSFDIHYADNISISNNILQIGTKIYNKYDVDCYGYINTDFPININNKLIYSDVLLNNYYNSKTIDTMHNNLKTKIDDANRTIIINYPNTLPIAGNRELNTYYIVQLSSGGNVYRKYFIDKNDNAINLGTTDDLTNYYTKTETDNKFLDKQNFLNKLYPKGSIYITYENKNPETFLGGIWELVGGQDSLLNYYPAYAIITDTAGTTISETLPNITGQLQSNRLGNGDFTLKSGVFNDTVAIEQAGADYSVSTNTSRIDFKASNSSSIYQNNAHVNVNAIKLFFWQRTDDAEIQMQLEPVTKINDEIFEYQSITRETIYSLVSRKKFSDYEILNFSITATTATNNYSSMQISPSDFASGKSPLFFWAGGSVYANIIWVSDTQFRVSLESLSNVKFKIEGLKTIAATPKPFTKLFDGNFTGTSGASLKLNDSIENYEFIELYGRRNGYMSCVRVPVPYLISGGNSVINFNFDDTYTWSGIYFDSLSMDRSILRIWIINAQDVRYVYGYK